MGSIPPKDQFLFYIQNEGAEPQFLFENTKDGLDAINIDSAETSSIASVICKGNYDSLVQTIKGSKQKVVDEKGNTTYLVRLEDGSKLAGLKNTELVTLRNVEQLAKAVKQHQPSRLSPQFSTDFLEKAPLLIDQQQGVSPLEGVSGKTQNEPYSQIVCTSESAGADGDEDVDLENQTITIDGHTYKITYSVNNKERNLENVPPQERQEFLALIRQSIIDASKGSDLDDVNSVTLSFDPSCELTEIKSLGSNSSDVIFCYKGTDPFIQKTKEDFKDIIPRINQSSTQILKSPLGINGVPRGSQDLSCWFGSGLQVAAHLYGDILERALKDCQKSGDKLPEYLEPFVHMKRKILNEEPGPITEKEVTDLFSKLQMAGILNAAFDLKKQNDPQDFIGALNGHQPFSSSKNIAVDGSKPLAIKDLIEAKVGTDPIQDEQTTLNVFIQRNLATNKTTNQITIEKTIEIPDGSGSHFELVGATVHRGDQVAAGHFVAYSYQNGKWYECNDETVSEVLDEKKLLESLSTSATELVYRKLPQPINQLLESEVAPLHSLSLVDTDRWVTSKVVLDWAEKNAEKKENTTVVHTTTPATPLFKVGNGVDLRDLGAEIDKINEGQTAFIPLIKVKDSTDQASKHFVALVVDKSKDPHSYEYFDSTGKAIPQELDTLIKSKNNNQSPLIIVDQANAWQQDDGYRCGYYVSRFFELRADNDAETIQKNQDERHPNVNQVNELRLRMRLNYNRFQDNYGFHG